MTRAWATAILLACATASADSDEIPTGDDAFTAYVRERVQLYTALKVTSPHPLTVTVTFPSTASISVSLAELKQKCMQDASKCESLLRSFINEITYEVLTPEPVANRSLLRIALSIPNKFFAFTDPAVSRKAFGDFNEECQKDPERAVRFPLRESEAQTLALSNDDALALCEKNTRDAIGPMPDAYSAPMKGSIGIVRGSNYESSRMLFLDEWKALAQSLVGGLLVAVPDR